MTPQQARAFHEGVAFAERFFMGDSEVYKALRKVCATLDAHGIPYAVAGAMALNTWGYRRVTTDVALLLTREGLDAFKSPHLGRGWVERFAGSKGMRDTEYKVAIDVLLAGEYPGDGTPDPCASPIRPWTSTPTASKVLPLERLIELKLASGLSAPHRGKDLVDVQELIHHAALPPEVADSLDASVRDEYRNRWHLAQASLRDDD